MSTKYRHPAIRQFAEHQVRYAPVDVRIEQMDKAEQLLQEIVPEQRYYYADVCERITAFRPQMYPDLRIDGTDLLHDLPLLVEDLSASADLPVERAQEPVFTVSQLSERFNVSTKTVDRWRKRGLVSRRFRIGNRSRVGFLRSSVDRFVRDHEEEVLRGGRFVKLSEAEREEVISKARRLARHGANQSEVIHQLAPEFERSPETIRYTIQQFDHDHPESAVFPDRTTPLSNQSRQDIFQQFQAGLPADRLAEAFGRTSSSIYRIITSERAEQLLAESVDYIDSPEFRKPNADRIILGPAPEIDRKQARVKAPPGLPPYLASLYTVALLTREEEGYYFRKMNYLKMQAKKLQEKIDRSRPKASDLDRLEGLLAGITEVKNFLIRSNLRLVVSIAKRHMTPNASFFEMVSDGNMSLIRAIEKFDYSKGNKFSTYATWAIMKNYARSIPKEFKTLERFRTGTDEIFLSSPEDRSSLYGEERTNAEQHQVLMSIIGQLEDRERSIILQRYGLEQGTEPQTLEQVGQDFGVTKERIRQIETRALQKLRKIAAEEKLEIPGI
ncbi:MAG: sigma-70 family RNA polymerase sigma factor [Planctomycetaceae bacterium]